MVTGASRGIGEAIANTLARDGAHVVGLDVPALAADLDRVVEVIGGSAIAVDITASDAPEAICDELERQHGGVDVVVHNAGITRDKTLGGMDEERWSLPIEINLTAEERINDELLGREGLLNPGGRIVCVSSMSGIAGNAGQTNYATSKAGVIGMVEAMAPVLAERTATINAVAPGFIETQMTAAMPIGPREAGRRMNSLSQGGLPVDVAETIAWLAAPDSTGLNGNVDQGLRAEPDRSLTVAPASEHGASVRVLGSMPSLLPLYGRVAFAAVPGAGLAGRLPFVPGGRGEDLPAERLGIAGVRADPGLLARYCRVCGFTLRDELPATYPHVLSFPLQMELMASGSFPFPLLGLVHLENAITQHRPVALGEPLDFEVGATDLRLHPKGTAFSLVAEARTGDELVWEERGTILHRGGGDPGVERGAGPERIGDDVPAAAEWRLSGDLGRRYAAVSGDRNPIHMHPLTARAFGFPRPIAHGMWSKARSLAQLEGRIPASFSVAVSFRRPLPLPGRVRFAADSREDGSTGFELRGPEPVDPPIHLVGELRPLG